VGFLFALNRLPMKLALAPLFAVAVIFAIAADPPFAELSNLTATAILGWYAWHTATCAIPQLVADFRSEMALERNQNHSDRDDFFRELAEERVQRHADNTALILAVDDLKSLLGHWKAATADRHSL
jgi:hypothetical protein